MLNDGTVLTVTDIVSAPSGDVVLHAVGGGGVVIGPLGSIVAAPASGTVSVQADALTLSGGGISGGIFEFALDTPGVLEIGPGGQLVSLAGIASGLVRFGAAGGAITATGLTLTAELDLGIGNGGVPRALDLETTGNIDDRRNPLANVTTLSGSASNGLVTLGNSRNSVASLGSFSIGTGFTFADVSDLTISGLLAAGPVLLNAPNLTVTGALNTGTLNALTLIASNGTIGGAGIITTGTLTGSAISSVSLSGKNQIGTLDAFTASALTLNTIPSLTITNNVSVSGSVALISGGVLTVNSGQTVTGTAVALNATGLAIDGAVTDGGAGTVNLMATSGSITIGGNLIAGTLTGSAAAAANLLGTTSTSNLIGNLGSFSAAGFTLNDGRPLTVAGTVSGGANVTITDTGTLTNTGKISGTAISLTADNLNLGGVVTDGGAGTVALLARTTG